MNNDDDVKNVVDAQEAEQAIPPAPPHYVRDVLNQGAEKRKETKVTIEETLNRKEKLLKELSESDSWKVFRDDVLLKFVDNMRRSIAPSPQGGIDLNAIGLKFMIVDQVQKLVEDAIAIVDAPKKAVDFPEGGDETEV